MRIVAVCSWPSLTGNVPVSRTPGTNVKSCSTTRGALEAGIAAAQPAEARPDRQFRVGLQRRADHLAVEVEDRVEHRRERLSGLAAEHRWRVDVGELGRGDRRGGEMVLRGRARLDRLPARPTAEERLHRLLGAAAEVAAEHRMAGEGDDAAAVRRGSARRRARALAVGVRRSCCAGEDQRRHVRQRALCGWRRRGVGPARRSRARGSRPGRWSRRTGRSRRSGWRAARSALRLVGSPPRPSAARETAAPRRRCR